MEHLQIETTWTDKDWDKFTEWLNSMLRIGPATVTFTKKDGTERVMNCTLVESYLPDNNWGSKELTEEKEKEYLAVWDIDKSGWRSFRWDSVTSFIIL